MSFENNKVYGIQKSPIIVYPGAKGCNDQKQQNFQTLQRNLSDDFSQIFNGKNSAFRTKRQNFDDLINQQTLLQILPILQQLNSSMSVQSENPYKKQRQNEFYNDHDQENQIPLQKNSKGCNCKKTRCLKLYCECFASGNLCTSECNCQDCCNNSNNLMNKRLRDVAIDHIIERQPNAFESKFTIENQIQSISSDKQAVTHKKGCNCKKSNCQKKYCECFNAGLKCTSVCKCVDCLNIKESSDYSRLQKFQGNTLISTNFSDENSEQSIQNNEKYNVKDKKVFQDITSFILNQRIINEFRAKENEQINSKQKLSMEDQLIQNAQTEIIQNQMII